MMATKMKVSKQPPLPKGDRLRAVIGHLQVSVPASLGVKSKRLSANAQLSPRCRFQQDHGESWWISWCNFQLFFLAKQLQQHLLCGFTKPVSLSPPRARKRGGTWLIKAGRSLGRCFRTLWLIGMAITNAIPMSDEHLKFVGHCVQALDKLCAVRMKQSCPWICDRLVRSNKLEWLDQ